MTRTGWTRRRFGLAGTSAALGLLGTGDTAAAADAAAQLVEILPPRARRAAIRIGRLFLRSTAAGAGVADLVAELAGDGAFPAGAPLPLRRRWFEQRRRSDFAEGRTVWVGGWLLAQSEVRLCALCALVDGA